MQSEYQGNRCPFQPDRLPGAECGQQVITSLPITREIGADLLKQGKRQCLRVAGLVAVRQAPPTAKGFAFFTLEDERGLLNVIVRPDIFKAQRETWVSASVLAIEGVVERARGQINVLAERGWRVR